MPIEEQARAVKHLVSVLGQIRLLANSRSNRQPGYAGYRHCVKMVLPGLSALNRFSKKQRRIKPSDVEIEIYLASEKRDSQALGISLVLKHSSPGTLILATGEPFVSKDYTGIIGGCVLRKEIRSGALKALPPNHEEQKGFQVVVYRVQCGEFETILKSRASYLKIGS